MSCLPEKIPQKNYPQCLFASKSMLQAPSRDYNTCLDVCGVSNPIHCPHHQNHASNTDPCDFDELDIMHGY